MLIASPFRYPGGKARLHSFVSGVLEANGLVGQQYLEPFAGGGGLALSLLYTETVSDIHINDIDPGVWSFWHSVLEHNDELAERIADTPISIEEWDRQREIRDGLDTEDPLALGFATFFLNRTNRSGVLDRAGAIGGREQDGRYKLDCRFYRSTLVERVRRIAKFRDHIHLSGLDALDFIEQSASMLPDKSLFFLDPPYYNKGSRLYTNYYEPDDHGRLAKAVLGLKNPWLVTYDNEADVRNLYAARKQVPFFITYSLARKRVGTEILIASEDLRLPENAKTTVIWT